jgi:hypothetical protein
LWHYFDFAFEIQNFGTVRSGNMLSNSETVLSCISLVQPSLSYNDYGTKGGGGSPGDGNLFAGELDQYFLDLKPVDCDICN